MLMAPISVLTIRNCSVKLDQGHMLNITPFTFIHVKHFLLKLFSVYRYSNADQVCWCHSRPRIILMPFRKLWDERNLIEVRKFCERKTNKMHIFFNIFFSLKNPRQAFEQVIIHHQEAYFYKKLTVCHHASYEESSRWHTILLCQPLDSSYTCTVK
jgi:hypothetical protein